MPHTDLDHARWAAEQGVKFVGPSFVRSALDIERLRDTLRRYGSDAWVVAKIEKPEALENLVSIVLAADAVKVARGDLGVETDVANAMLDGADACMLSGETAIGEFPSMKVLRKNKYFRRFSNWLLVVLLAT